MDIIYRIFFMVLSLGILMILLLPVVLLFRFFVRNQERKYIMWQWKLLFIRSICPFFMTSALCMIPVWNRRFYLLLNNLGMILLDKKGVVFRVRDVFLGRIQTSFGFRICSILWAVGVVSFLFLNLYNKYHLNLLLATAKEIGEDIYEVSSIHLPLQVGFIKKKWYLPPEFHVSELRWLLRHMEKRGAEGIKRVILVLILSLHWFNPVMWLYYYLWSKDNEIHADEKTVYHGNMMKRREYAQSIMNFRYRTYTHKNAEGIFEEDPISDDFGMYAVYERNTEKRARRMMYQKWDNAFQKFFGKVFVLAVLSVYFVLAPLSSVWAGGTWNPVTQSQTVDKTSDEIITKKRKVVVGANTTSPEGLGRVLQLEMKSGGIETEDGYDGMFSLVFYDQMDNKLSYLDMDTIFSRSIKSSYHFSKNMSLVIEDYNEDGTQEVLLGQKLILTQNEFENIMGKDAGKSVDDYLIYQYSIINLATEQMTVMNQGILSVTKKTEENQVLQTESIILGTVDGVNGIVYTEFDEDRRYYEWNQDAGSYSETELTDADIEARKNGAAAGAQAGQVNEHSLQDENGEDAILVTTQTDSTGSEAIQSVILSPRNDQKKFEDIKGYYCNLVWAPSGTAKTEEQYAVLIYNGTKSQTFIIYDLKAKGVYYQHEDGTANLADIFAEHNETDITFENPGVVLYNLSEKNQDTLKIDFAATADGNITVKGSYEYSVARRASANLSFSRSIDENTETNVVPAPEMDGGEFDDVSNDLSDDVSPLHTENTEDFEDIISSPKPASGTKKTSSKKKGTKQKNTSTKIPKKKAAKKNNASKAVPTPK